jgi:hypothetical protein
VSRVALSWALAVTVLIVPDRVVAAVVHRFAAIYVGDRLRLTVVAAIFLVRKRISANARSTLAAGLLLMAVTVRYSGPVRRLTRRPSAPVHRDCWNIPWAVYQARMRDSTSGSAATSA